MEGRQPVFGITHSAPRAPQPGEGGTTRKVYRRIRYIEMSEKPTAGKGSRSELPDETSVAHLALVLAHRLGGLVAGIEGYTDLLADTLVSAEQRELAMKILEGTARIESVLADLQVFGESRRPAMLPLRVGDLTRDLLSPLEDHDAGRVRLCVGENVASISFEADPFLLRQALLVLIQNALDASEPSSEVIVTAKFDDEQVYVDVRNEGTIDADGGEHLVFVPFYTTKAQNLGVGLSIALRIAKLHSGHLELTSNSPEDGTCFTLFIPRSNGSSDRSAGL